MTHSKDSHHPHCIKVYMRARILRLAIGLALYSGIANANIVTDGTVGSAQTLAGPDFMIPQDLGAVHGHNLFHSFHTFSIDQSQSATFTGSDAINHVIARVTGGEASQINGLLRSQIGHADFYFINPAGVIFGPHAVVDVPAGFHVSTAHTLAFTDGNQFHAIDPTRSTLTQAPPEAFGFMDAQPVAIHINGSRFEFNPKSEVSLVSSGNITITGTDAQIASLTSPNGDIQLTALGDIVLDHAEIQSGGHGGGSLTLNADNIYLHHSTLAADNLGTQHADRGIRVEAKQYLELTEGSRIQSNVFAEGDGGKIYIQAQDMRIYQQDGEAVTGIFSEVERGASGSGQGIEINVADTLSVEGVSNIHSATYGTGHAANVKVFAGTLVMDGEDRSTPYRDAWFLGGISSETAEDSVGNAGDVNIEVRGLISLFAGTGISGSTSGQGNAGNITITAGDMKIDGRQGEYMTVITSDATPFSQGVAGHITLLVPGQLQILNGGQISSSSWRQGDAGNITITVGDMSLDGQGDSAFIVSVVGPGSQGHAGDITINVVGALQLLDGGQILSNTWGWGNAGTIYINVGEIQINRQQSEYFTGIASQANRGSQGLAGKVHITAEGLFHLLNGGQVTSSTFAKGNAGMVTIEAGEMLIDGQGTDHTTSIASTAEANSLGHAGNVTLKIGSTLHLLSGGQIASGTYAIGDAGTVTINAGSMILDGRGSAYFTGVGSQAEPSSQGNAGDIVLSIEGLLQLLHGGQISTGTWAIGNAGTLRIKAGEMRIDRQGSQYGTGTFSVANQDSQGHAGRIYLAIDGLLQLLNGGAITSSTLALGDAGSITIEAQALRIDAGLIESTATGNLSGYVGKILIATDAILLRNGARISIAADQSLSVEKLAALSEKDIQIDIRAKTLDMAQDSNITSQSMHNVPAAPIVLRVNQLLVRDNSQINTSTQNADGGNITVLGDVIYLWDGLITTSVEDRTGDGGNITLAGIKSHIESGLLDTDGFLVMQGGFIQANTAAPDARGGDILVNVKGILLCAGTQLRIGSEVPEVFRPGGVINIIQAAAPQGNPGSIPIAPVQLDLANTIAPTEDLLMPPVTLAEDFCRFIGTKRASTLVPLGRGGLPETLTNPLMIFFAPDQLEELM